MKKLLVLPVILLALTLGCASQSPPEVTIIDYRNTEGVYILVYSTDQEFRTLFEDQLVADLADREIVAFASHPDLPDASDTGRTKLLGAANARKAMFILVIEELMHGESGVVRSDNPNRISQDDETLREFYENTLPADHDHEDDEQVFVEVSGFLIQEDYAKLIWSGTTWTVRADGQEGRISDLSATIAREIDTARRKRRLGL